MSSTEHGHGDLRSKLEAMAPRERLDYLAALSREELAPYKRILTRDDRRKLNRHIDDLERQRRRPTVQSWLAEARAGRAATPEAMIEVLREVLEKLRPQDADWVRRIDDTASASGFSRRQREVIGAIYTRYFPKTDR